MTHTPKALVKMAVSSGLNTRQEVLKFFLTDGYSLKTAKRWLRDLEDNGLIREEDGSIWPNFPMR